MKVAVLLADGFETLEGLTVVDILRRAEVCCDTFGIDKGTIITSHKVEVRADKILGNEVYDYDIIVLPGGMPGSANLRDNIKVNQVVEDFYNKGKIIAAICAAPIVLGKLGIVNGKDVTCYPGFENQLGCCNYKKELVVVDGNIITGRGPAAAVPFAFEILKYISPEKVNGIRKGMLFE